MVVKGNWAIFARLALALGVVVAGSSAGLAQDNYPNKPIKMVIGFGAGGPTDRAARLVAEAMASDLGQQVIVENRTGAGGRIATNLVINAPPDGYTLLLHTNAIATEPVVKKNLPYDARRDLTDVRDVVAAYLRIMDNAAAGTAWNVCSGTANRIGDLLDTLLGLAAVPITTSTDPDRMRPSDTPLLLGSHARLTAALGWTPTIPIQVTLADTLAWWRTEVRR